MLRKIKRFALLLCLISAITAFTSCGKNPSDISETTALSGETSYIEIPDKGDTSEIPTEAETEPEIETEEEETSSEIMFDVEKVCDYKSVSCEKLFKFKAKDSKYQVIQGSCIIGDTFYIASTRTSNGKETVRIIKLTADGEYIAESDPLELDHANNLSYNSRRSLILVSHCQSEDGHYFRYSFVNPETFETVETADLPYPFFSMAYSEEKDMYASGEWSGETLDTWDCSFNNVKRESVTTPQSLSQGVTCDGEYIYFIRSAKNGVGPEIRIYNWNLEPINVIPVDLDTRYEPESLIFGNGCAYIVCNDTKASGGFCFKAVFNIE